MKLGRALAAVVLAFSTTLTVLAAAPAQAVPRAGTGTLSVKVLDEHGKPLRGVLYLVENDGSATQLNNVTGVNGPIASGSYGVLSFTPWGGIRCVALKPCDAIKVAAGETSPTGALRVTEGKTTSARIKATAPASIAGVASPGRAVRLVWSRPMGAVVKIFESGGTAPVVQWLRDGKAVRGALGTRYVVSRADEGTRLSARMTYPKAAVMSLKAVFGKFSASRTTGPIKVRD